jgi:hypothetical protein
MIERTIVHEQNESSEWSSRYRVVASDAFLRGVPEEEDDEEEQGNGYDEGEDVDEEDEEDKGGGFRRYRPAMWLPSRSLIVKSGVGSQSPPRRWD